jgi:hypothetical protein
VIDCVNNVAYNYNFAGRFGNPSGSGTKLHFVGNRYKPGLDTPDSTFALIAPASYGFSQAYVFGNLGYNRLSDDDPNQWAITNVSQDARSFELFTSINVTAQDVDSVYNLVLDRAGAWPRDAADTRIIDDVRNGTGNWKNGRANQVVFYPQGSSTISSTTTTVTIRVAGSVPTDRWAVPQLEDSIEITGGSGYPQMGGNNIKKITDNTAGPVSTITIDGNFNPSLGTDTQWRIREVPPSPYSGDYPVLATGIPQTDSDSDGVPDVWEVFIGTNPSVSDAMEDIDGDGYKNLEEYGEYVLELLVSGLPPEPRYLLR